MKRTVLFRRIFFPLFISLLFIMAFRQTYRPPLQEKTLILMDTVWTIKIPGGPKMNSVLEKTFLRLKQIEHTFSISDHSGQIYRFNRLNIPIDNPEIIAVIKQAQRVSSQTGGAFDITVGPLLEAFGFYSKNYRVPSEREIKALLRHVDYRLLEVRDNLVKKKDKEVGIDLGGIAKSYAINEVLEVLKENDVKNAIIDGGGDIFALGTYNGKPWKVGIRSPGKEQLLGVLSLTNTAIFSSGDYERYFIFNGIRYHHIINPKTGYPARGLMGSTVIYPDPIKIGGFSSSLFVMGPQRALQTINQIAGAEVLLVTDKGTVLFSKNFPTRFLKRDR